MLGESQVHLYPAEELIAGDFSISSFELRAQRIETIDHMARVGKGVYITPIAGMRKFLPNREKWLKNSLIAKVGDTIDIEDWLEELVSMSYLRQPMVTAPGEFALRGGILDLYPLHMEDPVRIELFDTEIDSIEDFPQKINVQRVNSLKFQFFRLQSLFGRKRIWGKLQKHLK